MNPKSSPTICHIPFAIERIARWNDAQFRQRKQDDRRERILDIIYFAAVIILFALAASIQ